MYPSSAWTLTVLPLLITSVFASSSNDFTNARSYTVNVDPIFIEQTRLKTSTFHPSVDIHAPAWFDGPPTSEITALAKFWTETYDWSAEQSRINSNFSHYMISIPPASSYYNNSLDLHFIHQRSKRDDALPMLMLHGWPSTSLEWEKVIPGLVDPEDDTKPAFHIVAPDLPGFGFSPALKASGIGAAGHGAVFAKLMEQLGYDQYALYSTDLGTVVAHSMVVQYQKNIITHVTDFYIVFPSDDDEARFAANKTTAEENAYIGSIHDWLSKHAAYSAIDSTLPLSIAHALNDSPVGFLGWMYQLVFTVSDQEFTATELITRAMLLYIPGVYGNLRSYKELYGISNFSPEKPFTVPVAALQYGYSSGPIAVYPELANFNYAPRDWVERSANVTYFARHDRGGHFPAESVPDLVLADIRATFARK